jgi:uncharacterized protein with GYD domain
MTMATYVVLARFTAQGVKNAKESPKRAEAFKKMAETFGVTVKDIFWTQGRYDIVIVIEAPDELSATALNLSLSALGNIRTESLRAFSSTDMLKIVAKMLLPSTISAWVCRAHVRFGSKADIGLPPVDVRFTPKSGH